MKSHLKNSLFLLLFILIFSCNSSQDDEQVIDPPNNGRELVSITKNYLYADGYNEMMHISSGKITDIQYSDGNVDLYTYMDDNVSQIIKKNPNGDIKWTKTFTYDSSGRLIERREIPNPEVLIEWDGYYVYKFLYSATAITLVSHVYYFDEPEEGDGSQTLFDLEATKVSRYLPYLGFAHRDELIYNDENPLMSTHYFSNNPNTVVNYDYNTELAPDGYNIAKLMFGAEWKNNLVK